MRSRRTTELLLLLAALPILILLFAMAIINGDEPVTLSSFEVPLGLFVAFIISHLVIRRFAPHADPALLPIVFLLSGIGIAFVMRLAPDLALKQIGWLYLGIGAMILVLIFVKSIEKLGYYKYTLISIGLILLLLPAFAGVEIYGSKIWLSIGGFSFQPGEIAKVLIVLFLAAYLAENRDMLSITRRRALGVKTPDLRTLFPLLIMWGVSLLIVIFERDLGSALLFFGLFLTMIYVCTGRFFYVIGGVVLLAVGAVALYFLFSHVRARVAIWINPFDYAEGSGYQLVQALYSMADGGLFGTGIGRGYPTKIPVVESDFIFAAIAEEMGLLGAAAVLLLFVLFAVRGFLIAARAKSDMSALAAAGLTAAISLQAFVIIGGVTRLIPLTGLTLPFMSQGGSSLLASFIIVGLLLRAGDEGTGVETEMTGTVTIEGGVLGRVALGKRLTQLTIIFAVLFALLIANLTYIQIIKASDYQNMASNNHTLARNAHNERGSILTSDGTILAESIENEDGVYERFYPEGTLAAHLLGYDDDQYGTAGVEASQNDTLTGQSDFATWSDAITALSGSSTTGNDVVLTINSDVQRAAETALEGKTGAIVALDPETGAVLAMASSPTYDPNDVSALVSGTSSSDALYNRATQALYAPGSTFKMSTLATAIETNIANANSIYDSPGTMEIGGGAVTNFNSTDYGEITLKEATAVSSNTVFGQVAVQIGAKNLVAYAEKYGINSSSVAQDFSLTTSLLPDADQMTTWETAWAGVGQPVGQHTSAAGPQVTVMQMALIGSAIANNGILMKPYIIEKTMTSAGKTVSTTTAKQYGTVMKQATAQAVLDILTYVVESGSGAAARVDGVTVAGKTGTAQTGKAIDDAWFVGMAPAEDPKVVVAVVIEQGGSGSTAAAPCAQAVLQAALEAQGVL
jgi:cell division protein FtsI/penicillin-binding protein 2/cell division protein FtsW (lipid II flippase)